MKLYLDIDSGGHLDIVHNDAIAEPDFLADDTVCPEADAGQAGLLADDSAGTNTAVCQLENRSILDRSNYLPPCYIEKKGVMKNCGFFPIPLQPIPPPTY